MFRSFKRHIIFKALIKSLDKLKPRQIVRNPTLCLAEFGLIISFVYLAAGLYQGRLPAFEWQLFSWMLLLLIVGNFAESLAEQRGKAQAHSLRSKRDSMPARLLVNGVEKIVQAPQLAIGDILICRAGDIIPVDGKVVSGIATVDESAITGESAPVIREAHEDRNMVTGGTKVLSDEISIKASVQVGSSFIDRMVRLIESAKRQKTPSELSLSIVLSGLSIIFLLTTFSIKVYSDFAAASYFNQAVTVISAPVYISMFICLVPTTIGALFSAIGISGIDRMFRKNVIALNARSIEAAGDIDILMLDKTGTITLGNRQATKFIPAAGTKTAEFAEYAQLASISDETPEGRSIVILAKEKYGHRIETFDHRKMKLIPFSALTCMSGLDIKSTAKTVSIRKGSLSAIQAHLARLGAEVPSDVVLAANKVAKAGGTPLVVACDKRTVGVIYLKDIVKGGLKDRFAKLRKMGIRTVMVTGDNNLTAAAIAAEAGVDDFLAQATPETKLAAIKNQQQNGRLVAMAGDGTNDAPALAQADVGVAMNTGTKAAREAGNMIDLDSNPTKLIDIVETGKQILITRGSLMTFSIANDLAKFFAIVPTLFATIYAPSGALNPLATLNLMQLGSFQSALLSTVIFNVLAILGLIPLALTGVRYRSNLPLALLRKNLFIYGIGGLIAPFIGIKIIDLGINFLNLV